MWRWSSISYTRRPSNCQILGIAVKPYYWALLWIWRILLGFRLAKTWTKLNDFSLCIINFVYAGLLLSWNVLEGCFCTKHHYRSMLAIWSTVTGSAATKQNLHSFGHVSMSERLTLLSYQVLCHQISVYEVKLMYMVYSLYCVAKPTRAVENWPACSSWDQFRVLFNSFLWIKVCSHLCFLVHAHHCWLLRLFQMIHQAPLQCCWYLS